MKMTLYIKQRTEHDIANVLNLYFVNIGKHISASMNEGPYDHHQYLKAYYDNSLFFAPVSIQMLRK